jgi:hypothetical protein
MTEKNAIDVQRCSTCGVVVLNAETDECPMCGETIVDVVYHLEPGGFIASGEVRTKSGKLVANSELELGGSKRDDASWFYCFAHMRPHKAGVCHVDPAEHWLALKAQTRQQAIEECQRLGLKIMGGWGPLSNEKDKV